MNEALENINNFTVMKNFYNLSLGGAFVFLNIAEIDLKTDKKYFFCCFVWKPSKSWINFRIRYHGNLIQSCFFGVNTKNAKNQFNFLKCKKQ